MAEYAEHSRFSAKTYNLVADTIRESVEGVDGAGSDLNRQVLETLAHRLAFKFAIDNANFKARKFIEACGLEWKQ